MALYSRSISGSFYVPKVVKLNSSFVSTFGNTYSRKNIIVRNFGSFLHAGFYNKKLLLGNKNGFCNIMVRFMSGNVESLGKQNNVKVEKIVVEGNEDNGGRRGDANVQRNISRWLFGCAALVFGIVVVGGITRLTRSGLSMVEWKPLGHLPPMNEEEWEAEFARYKNFPEYKSLGREMKMSEFKFIYFFEYSHRMLARGVGVAFGLPFLYYAATKSFTPMLTARLAGIFCLGGLQGAIGWWMVKSGLQEEKHSYNELPRVSPYRLAVHLISAFIIFTGLLTTGLKVRTLSQKLLKLPIAEFNSPSWLRYNIFRKSFTTLPYFIGLTAFSGAFVAGNEAGIGYNDFPTMGGQMIPDGMFIPDLPEWKNLFENSIMVQFNHRYLGLSTATLCALLWFYGSKLPLPPALKFSLNLVFGLAVGQVSLGISTLMMEVPVPLAALHQAGSLALLSGALYMAHNFRVALPKTACAAAMSCVSISLDKNKVKKL